MSDDENEAVYVYWMGPGGSDPLCLAHEAEAARLGVEFRNYGWVSGDDFICSKTDKGYLGTEWDAQSQQWRHCFEQYDKDRMVKVLMALGIAYPAQLNKMGSKFG